MLGSSTKTTISAIDTAGAVSFFPENILKYIYIETIETTKPRLGDKGTAAEEFADVSHKENEEAPPLKKQKNYDSKERYKCC